MTMLLALIKKIVESPLQKISNGSGSVLVIKMTLPLIAEAQLIAKINFREQINDEVDSSYFEDIPVLNN